MSDKEKISRRTALKKIGGVTAGTIIGSYALGSSLSVKAEERSGKDSYPWPYTELDTEYVRKLGHEGYYLGNCSSGSFYAILTGLREEIGAPFTNIPLAPPNMMHFGGSGMVGRRLTCGALLGTFAAIDLVTEPEATTQIVDELFDWYAQAQFPSDTANRLGREEKYLVNEYSEDVTQTVAGSPSCEDSVTVWIGQAREPLESPVRSERCGRLTGDVVTKAVELLNEYV